MSLRYKHGMNWIRQEKRLSIYMRDNFACLYCGKGVEEEIILTLDHVVHRDGNEASNLVTACMDCNVTKGCWSLNRFLRGRKDAERVRLRVERHCAKDVRVFLPEAKQIIRNRKVVTPF